MPTTRAKAADLAGVVVYEKSEYELQRDKNMLDILDFFVQSGLAKASADCRREGPAKRPRVVAAPQEATRRSTRVADILTGRAAQKLRATARGTPSSSAVRTTS